MRRLFCFFPPRLSSWLKATVVVAFSLMLVAPVSAATLDLAGYLIQTQQQHKAYESTQLQRQASDYNRQSQQMLTSPTLFASGNTVWDRSESGVYDQRQVNSASVGARQIFDSGLSAKLSYDYNNVRYDLSNSRNTFNALYPDNINSRLMLELTQPLLAGAGGASIRAQKAQIEHSALLDNEQALYQQALLSYRAELAYWNLYFARQVLSLAEKAETKAQELFSTMQLKYRRNLAEQTELLQTEANLANRRLELERAQAAEQVAALEFNHRRARSGTQVEGLSGVSPSHWKNQLLKLRQSASWDARLSERTTRIYQAQAELSAQQNRPTLDVVAQLGTSGSSVSSQSEALGDNASARYPYLALGLNFSMSLNDEQQKRNVQAARLKAQASELERQQKQLDAEQSWRELERNTDSAYRQWEIAATIDHANNLKAALERQRWQQGRTTLTQVLQFEQEAVSSEQAMVSALKTVAVALAQLKLLASP